MCVFLEYHRYNVFNIIMVLLEDDEDIVRDIMCMRLSAHHVTLELAIKYAFVFSI